MSKRALFIEHDHVMIGGPIWRQFQVRGYEIVRFLVVPEDRYTSPNVTVEFPNPKDFDVIVPMGAPWGAYEDQRIGNWLLPELEFVRTAHAAGIPILGICFGGQLMARALGGSVARAPYVELGWYDIETDDESIIPKGPWFQFHWDRWTLPPQAREIARTNVASQAFICGRTLGVQFHPEIDPEVLQTWLTVESSCVDVRSQGHTIEDLMRQTQAEEPHSNKRAADLVDLFLDRIAVA